MKTNILQSQRKHLYKLLDTFTDKDFYAVKSFAEFLKKARKEKDLKLLQILLNAPFEEKELSEQTNRDIKKSELDIKRGRFRPLTEVMKDYGI
jgi:hypothetical protein